MFKTSFLALVLCGTVAFVFLVWGFTALVNAWLRHSAIYTSVEWAVLDEYYRQDNNSFGDAAAKQELQIYDENAPYYEIPWYSESPPINVGGVPKITDACGNQHTVH